MVAPGNDQEQEDTHKDDTRGETRQAHTTTSNDATSNDATSNDATSNDATSNDATSNDATTTPNDGAGEEVPKIIRLNPAIMEGVPPLNGLDEIQIVYFQPAPLLPRCFEAIVFHVLGAGIVAALVLLAGYVGFFHG